MPFLKECPKPIIDNLKYMENPFKIFDINDFNLEKKLKLNVEKELRFAIQFLYSYNGSTSTFNSYRKEIERLIQWSWFVENQSILLHKRENIEGFVQFCISPPKCWIGTQSVSRFSNLCGKRIPNASWRPFIVSLPKSLYSHGVEASKEEYSFSQSSVKSLFTGLSSFYEYLIEESAIDYNPVSLIRQKSKFIQKDSSAPAIRRLSKIQWEFIIETTQLMAEESPLIHERSLFIMNCLFAMYLRVSELVADERSTPCMGDFKKDSDGNWWFYVTGKGNKNRKITVCNEMLDALKRYRIHLGLFEYPYPDENIPVVAKVRGKGGITSTRQIRSIVQHCFDQAFKKMVIEGFSIEALELKSATVHWLRHTGISEDVKSRPREHVRDDAGHASMATTDRYIDSDLRERHQTGRSKKIKELF